MFELTGQQREAANAFTHWWNNKSSRKRNFFELSGPPGSGKSTIVSHIIRELRLDQDAVAYVAYTGKAALNLILKDCPTKTIHSLLYELRFEDKLDENDEPIVRKGKVVRTAVFKKRKFIDPGIELIVIDEGSMINKKMGEELLSFDIPIFILGDIDQLKPIFGESFFLQSPDVILTEILRQRADDPIIKLSQLILNNKNIPMGQLGPRCNIIRKESLTNEMLMDADIIICGKNATRAQINTHIRERIYGRKAKTLVVGDKIIVRRNNWAIIIDENISLINGLIGYVTHIHTETHNTKQRSIEIDFRPDFTDMEFYNIKIDLAFLYGEKEIERFGFMKSELNLIEYGNAITCHVAQGSEYDSVLIYDEPMGTYENHKRWRHTAVSRAKKNLIFAV